MTKRSRLTWLIIGGIILLVILIAALFLYSPPPQPIKKYRQRQSSPQRILWRQPLRNPHPAPSRSTARRYRPHRSISRLWPIPALREILPDPGSLSTERRKGFLMPARVRAGPLPVRPAPILLRWWRSLEMVRRTLCIWVRYNKEFDK